MSVLDIDDLNLLKKFTLKGEWWLPRNARQKVTGTLAYEPSDGIKLELDGMFTERGARKKPRYHPFKYLLEPIRATTIFGNASQTPVTLFKCYGRASNYIVNGIVFGGHFAKPSQIQFTSFDFSTRDLNEWVGLNGFVNKPEDMTDDGWSIKYVQPKPIVVTIPAARLRLEIVSLPTWHADRFSRTVTHETTINVIPNKPARWKTFRRRSFELQNLLLLLTGFPVIMRHMTGIGALKKDDKRKPFERFLRVFFVQKVKKQKDGDSNDSGGMLFPLSELGGDFDQVCDKYFRGARRLKSIYDVFYSTLQVPPPYMDTRFFNLAQLLESFHRKAMCKGGGKYIRNRRKWKQIRVTAQEAIPKEIPNAVRKAIQDKIVWANEFTFKERLQSIFRSLDQDTRDLLVIDVPRFIDAIRDTRNWLTHLERRRDSKAFRPSDWYGACQKLELLLLILMLKGCGLAEDRIVDRVKTCWPRRWGDKPFSFNATEDEDL